MGVQDRMAKATRELIVVADDVQSQLDSLADMAYVVSLFDHAKELMNAVPPNQQAAVQRLDEVVAIAVANIARGALSNSIRQRWEGFRTASENHPIRN